MEAFRLFLGSLLFVLPTSLLALEPPRCSDWTQLESMVCIFAGEDANLYARQCENPCWLGEGNGGLGCDREQVCYFNNPNNFRTVCSDWVKESNFTCYSPNSSSLEQRWVRACTVDLREFWCSEKDPNL